MFPTSFEESNIYLSPPPGEEKNCEPLSIFRGSDPDQRTVCISCWKVTQEELDEINRTGRVWLCVWGETMPPVGVHGTNPFRGPGTGSREDGGAGA